MKSLSQKRIGPILAFFKEKGEKTFIFYDLFNVFMARPHLNRMKQTRQIFHEKIKTKNFFTLRIWYIWFVLFKCGSTIRYFFKLVKKDHLFHFVTGCLYYKKMNSFQVSRSGTRVTAASVLCIYTSPQVHPH